MKFEFQNPTHLAVVVGGARREDRTQRGLRRGDRHGWRQHNGRCQGDRGREAFLRSIGCPTRLSELHVGEAMLPRYAQDTVRIVHDQEGRLPGRPPMGETEIVDVLRSAL